MNLKRNFKRILSGVMSAAMAATLLPSLPAVAEEAAEKYPYTMFAASDTEGAITINANNFCVNGNIATNGTIVSNGNLNVNGTKTENAGKEMIYIFDKIDSAYFSGNNIDEYSQDYTLEEINININDPLEVEGNATLTGNININTALKAFEDVTLNGEVKNTNNSVIFSKYGDIVIDSQNVNLNGLVYAPFGNVEIMAQNLNLNNVVIIADTITFNCPSVNANYSGNAGELVGTVSEPLDIPVDEWQYMKDENDNGLPDFFEDMNNWELLKDTDGDKLPDCVEQYLGSDSTLVDTDGDLLDDYYEVFEKHAKEKMPIICICITRKFSGSLQSATTAKDMILEEYPDAQITVIDSTVNTVLQGLYVLEACRLRDMGLEYQQIVDALLPIRETGRIFFTIGSIDYLKHGGRIGKLAGIAASALKIKPLITLKEGEIFNSGITRNRLKSMKKVVDMTREYLDEVNAKPGEYSFCIGYGYDHNEALEFREMLKDLIKERLGIDEIGIYQIGATIGVHTGPYPIGIGIIKHALTE